MKVAPALETLMQPETRARESLEEVTDLALEFGRLSMVAGASARHVEDITERIALGLGAERIDMRVGDCSLAVTISLGHDAITRISKVGPLGVNERLHSALSAAAARIDRCEMTVTQARTELTSTLRDGSRHADWLVTLGVSVACAAFGRLMGIDWRGVGPIFLGAALVQIIRRGLALHNVNPFISAATAAFLGSALCGFGARWVGSPTAATNVIAPVLLLVPGVPLFNAQCDILEGRPSLGTARAVWAVEMLLFITLGVWLARELLEGAR
jgi:uncharacterized membrane protein YjjP (DUF1212 family)